jgi:CRISPR-associated protein Csb2
LFSAFVASAYRSCDGITEQKRAALKWFEALAPPYIKAPKADLIQSPVSYVPPGDYSTQYNAIEHGVHRKNQPRNFPSAIILDEPTVYYGWDLDPEPNIFAALKKMAADISHVGTSHSMAVASLHPGNMPEKASFSPDKRGNFYFRVPIEGRLDELDKVFEYKTGVRRPPSTCEPLAAYRRSKVSTARMDSTFDFITLRIAGTMHGADTAAYLGKTLRRAVMSVLGDDAPAAVHGHNGGDHIAWLSLPDVGHRHAKGRIVGVGIAFPQGMDPQNHRDILAGIGRIKNLCLPDGRTAQLVPIPPGEKVPAALKNRTWVLPSEVWSTVTPVVLDRPPKRLTEDRLRFALAQSLVFAGYPEPLEVEVSSFSKFDGAPPAFRVPAKKPRYHATISFPGPVAGPVIAGRMRYFGVGFFRPVTSSVDGGAA